MKVLITGGRNYSNWRRVKEVLDDLHNSVRIEDARFCQPVVRANAHQLYEPITELISGGATGADYHGKLWALARDILHTEVLANWKIEGRKAGPLRNQRMIDLKPDVLVAFPGGRGTADCLRRARLADIPIIGIIDSSLFL